MMMILYRLLYLPGLILGLPYYAWRMWRRGGYRKGFGNRFGLMDKIPPKRKNVKRIWIQAVSVGELLAIGPLLQQLQEFGDIEVILTTTTSTGRRVLEEKLAPLVAWHGTFPLDFWPFSRSAWKKIQPDMAILMEGELWPEHIHQAHRGGVPVLLVNARLSDRSFRRHLKLRSFARAYMRHLDYILAGSETDRERLLQLGWVSPERILSTGNLKLDIDLPDPPGNDEREIQLSEFGMPPDGTLLLLGSSTWPGEESALVEAYLEMRPVVPGLRLLIVPRHAERKSELLQLMSDQPVVSHFRSDGRQAQSGTEVYIADTTGELKNLTRFADLVFVGKSLPPNTGGQTPVEAAAMGKALVFGPDMSNFRDISRSLIRSGAAIAINSTEDLQPALGELLSEPVRREEMGRNARAFIEQSRGATGRIIQQIRSRLDQPS
jgi:3-deoxy-D-manno-octulosonic-acid transferase